MKSIEHLARYRNFRQVFHDMVDIMLCCLSYGTMEEKYLEIIGKYTEEEVKVDWPKTIALLQMCYFEGITADGGWIDPLGDVFMESGSKWSASGLGQFFTPEDVCTLLAELTDRDEEIHTKPFKANDCAAGSGRTLLAYSRRHPSYQRIGTYIAQDLDQLCVKMCAVNMFFHGLSGYSIHMNTLSMKAFGGYRIYLGQTGLGIRQVSVNYICSVLSSPKEETVDINPGITKLNKPEPATQTNTAPPNTTPMPKGSQMDLFGGF